MKLVVDVPEGNYKALKKMSGCCGLGVYHEMILNGIPLSEELEKILNGIRQIPHHNVEYIKSEYIENLILHHISELKGEVE